MNSKHNLNELNWKMVGTYPYENYLNVSLELGTKMKGEMDPLDVKIPCSVQKALLEKNVIEDWNYGFNTRKIEWIENRFWVFLTQIPEDWFFSEREHSLLFEGLDYNGEIFFGGEKILDFSNSLKTHEVTITEQVDRKKNRDLMIVFHTPPRWLGQFGYTSEFTDLKPRFYYWWDWTSRMVQTGITGDINLISYQKSTIENCYTYTHLHLENEIAFKGMDYNASVEIDLKVKGSQDCSVLVEVWDEETQIFSKTSPYSKFKSSSQIFEMIGIQPWWPHSIGEQKTYTLMIYLLDSKGDKIETLKRTIGFRKTEWTKNQNAEHADPWIFNINGHKIFLTGINWTPIKPNYADVTREEYKNLLMKYRELGIRLLRVWGGAYLETFDFYDLCDELGFLVWQEFPLSSSGLDNCPPEDPNTIKLYTETAKSYIERRHFHPSHIMWCGGNELREYKTVQNIPVSNKHPMIQSFEKLIQEFDPSKRFIPSTPCGPEFNATPENFGKGLHWAVNGPWKAVGRIENNWSEYFNQDDSLIRTEIGAPAPSSASLIEKYKGDLATTPCDNSNDLWRRQSWWTEAEEFENENGKKPENLLEYVEWGQKRQKEALLIAAECCVKRFPECGGIIFWMGHDSFPCTANTSLIDFEGNPKPAMIALSELWKKYDSSINPKIPDSTAIPH